MASVARGGLRLAQLLEFGDNSDPPRLEFAVVGERFRFWIDNDQAVGAIDEHLLAGLQFVGRVVQSDDRRNVERPRKDRSVRGAAAQIGRDAQHALLLHRGGIGGREVVRDENVRLGQGEKGLGRFTLEIVNDAFHHILDVERAFTQIGIIHLAQRLDVFGRDLLKHPLDIAKIGLQFAQHLIDEAPMEWAIFCCISRICTRVWMSAASNRPISCAICERSMR